MAASTNLNEKISGHNEILVGPWGGTGGDSWNFKLKEMTTQIDVMVYNEVIRSLTFTSKNANGTVEDVIKVGRDGGSNAGQVIINAPSEYLTGVSGMIGKYQDLIVLSSLKCRLVDAIGVNMVQKPIYVGPWGGPGGDKWDFKPKEMIKQIDIMVYNDVIRSLTFTSKGADGTVDAVIKVGKDGGTNAGQVSINDPSEYLTGASGMIGKYQDLVVLSSLKFHTNMTEYGPYGTNSGTPFSFVIQDGKIAGFHGHAGWYVDAIGAYVVSK